MFHINVTHASSHETPNYTIELKHKPTNPMSLTYYRQPTVPLIQTYINVI